MKHIIFFIIIIFTTWSLNAQWERCDLGLPVYTNGITAIGLDGKNMAVGNLADGSLYISTNNGDNWYKSNSTYKDPIWSILIKGEYIFVGTGGGGLEISNNFGLTWKNAKNLVDRVSGEIIIDINSLALKDNRLYAGTCFGLYYSDDYGESWICLNQGEFMDMMTVTNIYFKNNDIFIGVQDWGIFTSSDSGKSWIILTQNGLPTGHIGRNSFVICGTNLVTGITNKDYKDNSIYISKDDGNSWNLIYFVVGEYRIGGNTSCDTNLFTVLYNSQDTGFIYSSDYGASWKKINNGAEQVLGYLMTNSQGFFPFGCLATNGEYLYFGTTPWTPYGVLFRAKLKDCVFDSTSTAVEEFEPPPAPEFSIAPSPAADYIEISVGSRLAMSAPPDIRIYDIYGELVISTATNGNSTQRIDVSGLAAGVYFVQIGDNFAKFVKVK